MTLQQVAQAQAIPGPDLQTRLPLRLTLHVPAQNDDGKHAIGTPWQPAHGAMAYNLMIIWQCPNCARIYTDRSLAFDCPGQVCGIQNRSL